MDQQIEKAYFLSRTEFLMLLGLAGAGQVYSFPLPGRDEIKDEDLIRALYQLAKKGFLQMGDVPALSPSIQRLLEMICQARWALQVIPGDGGPQRICYLSGEQAAVAESSREGGELRLCLLSREELAQQIMAGSIPAHPALDTDEESSRLLRFDETAKAEQETLLSGQLLSGREASLLVPAAELAEQSGVLAVLELFDIKKGRVQERLLFLEGSVISWILRQGPDTCTAAPDTLEGRGRMQAELTEAWGEAGTIRRETYSKPQGRRRMV